MTGEDLERARRIGITISGNRQRFLERLEAEYPDFQTTSQALHNYEKGKRRPSVEWLKATAKVTGDRPEWLILLDGERNEEDERTAQRTGAIETIGAPVDEPATDQAQFRKKFAADFPEYYEDEDGLTPTIKLEFENVYARYVKHVRGGMGWKERCKVACWLGGLLRSPFDAPQLGVNYEGLGIDVRSPEWTDFAWAMLHSVALAMSMTKSALNDLE